MDGACVEAAAGEVSVGEAEAVWAANAVANTQALVMLVALCVLHCLVFFVLQSMPHSLYDVFVALPTAATSAVLLVGAATCLALAYVFPHQPAVWVALLVAAYFGAALSRLRVGA